MRSAKINQIDGPEAFTSAFPVSRETLDRLMAYEALLKRWQKTINLVAPSTINHIWHRHFADSAQVWRIVSPSPLRPTSLGEGERVGVRGSGPIEQAPRPCRSVVSPLANHDDFTSGDVGLREGAQPDLPTAQHWLDLGSGAGFPGLVIAIMAAETGGTRHTLVESDNRKAAFLREAARELGVAVDILCARIENPETRARVGEINCVTARALAPLPRLAQLVAPYFEPGVFGIFSKGRELAKEIEETALSWDVDFELVSSVTDADARLLLLKSLKPKA